MMNLARKGPEESISLFEHRDNRFGVPQELQKNIVKGLLREAMRSIKYEKDISNSRNILEKATLISPTYLGQAVTLGDQITCLCHHHTVMKKR